MKDLRIENINIGIKNKFDVELHACEFTSKRKKTVKKEIRRLLFNELHYSQIKYNENDLNNRITNFNPIAYL